ncbi:hypothetical protein EDC36_109121, partial [Tepidimonas ignava]
MTLAQRLKLIELYIGYFNRAPEQAGLDYWAGELAALLGRGVTEAQAYQSIADRFYDAGLQFGLYKADDSVESFIQQVY